ncbi:MAG: CBS domain-containing protein [Bdellovibrionota bacterium]
MRVRDVMSREIVSCSPETPVRRVAKKMSQFNCGMIPVLSDDGDERVMGVITERDIICRAVSEGADLSKVPASFCMSYPVVSISEKSSLGECMRLMRENQIRRIVVINDDQRCIGIVSQVDLYKASNGRGFLFSYGDKSEEIQSIN